MNLSFLLLSGLALHLLMAWLLIRALRTHRHHVAHHRFEMRLIGRDERSHLLIDRIVSRPAKAGTTNTAFTLEHGTAHLAPWVERALTDDHREDVPEETLEAVTSGQRVLGVLFVLGFAAFILFCLSDPTP